jgi:hypothetical protein
MPDYRLRLLIEAADNTSSAFSALSNNLKGIASDAEKVGGTSKDSIGAISEAIDKSSAGTNAFSEALKSLGINVSTLPAGFKSTADAIKELVIQGAEILGIAIAFKAIAEEIVNLTKESTLLAAREETLGIVLQQVGHTAGYTTEELNKYEESTVKMGITTSAARHAMAQMVQAHLDLASASKIARIAQDAAVIANINSSEAFERLVHGIQVGRPIILRSMGIFVDFNAAYGKMATELHKTTAELTASDLATARMNATLESGKTIAGAYEAAMGTAGKQLLSLQRFSEEAKVALGKLFLPALSTIVMEMTEGFKHAREALEAFEKTPAGEKLMQTFKDVVAWIGNAISRLVELAASLVKLVVTAGEVSGAFALAGGAIQLIGAAFIGLVKYATDFINIIKAVVGWIKPWEVILAAVLLRWQWISGLLKTIGMLTVQGVGYMIDYKAGLELAATAANGFATSVKGIASAFMAMPLISKIFVVGSLVNAVKEVYDIVQAYRGWKDAQEDVTRGAERNAAAAKKVADAGKVDIRTKEDLTKLSDQQIKAYNLELAKALQYYTYLENAAKMTKVSKQGILWNTSTKEDDEAIKGIEKQKDAFVNAMREVNQALIKRGQPIQPDDIMPEATIKKVVAAWSQAYDAMIKKQEELKNKQLELANDLIKIGEDTANKITALEEKRLKAHGQDEDAWILKRSQAEEDLAKAKETLTKAAGMTDEKEQELAIARAKEYAKQAASLYEGLAVEVKQKNEAGKEEVVRDIDSTVAEAKAGVTAVGEVLVSINKLQSQVVTDNQKNVEASIETIKSKMEELKKLMAEGIEVKVKGVDAMYQQIMDALNKLPKSLTISVNVEKPSTILKKDIEQQAQQQSQEAMAEGGRIPGASSKKDSVLVKARPGEWFIKNEAADFWGNRFMYGVNRPESRAGQAIINALKSMQSFADGGMVQNITNSFTAPAAPAATSASHFGTINLSVGGKAYPVFSSADVASKLKDALRRESMMRTA